MIKLWCNMRFGCLPLGKPKGFAQRIRYHHMLFKLVLYLHNSFITSCIAVLITGLRAVLIAILRACIISTIIELSAA